MLPLSGKSAAVAILAAIQTAPLLAFSHFTFFTPHAMFQQISVQYGSTKVLKDNECGERKKAY